MRHGAEREVPRVERGFTAATAATAGGELRPEVEGSCTTGGGGRSRKYLTRQITRSKRNVRGDFEVSRHSYSWGP